MNDQLLFKQSTFAIGLNSPNQGNVTNSCTHNRTARRRPKNGNINNTNTDTRINNSNNKNNKNN